MNNPESRYLSHLLSFEEKLKKSVEVKNKNPLASLGHVLFENEGRTPFFQLQGLARLEIRAGKNEKKALKWLNDFKTIEDAFGKYDYWLSFLIQNKRWNLPIEMIEYIEKQLNYHLGVLEERLSYYGWIHSDFFTCYITDKAITEYKRQLKKSDWYTSSKEARKISGFLRDETIEIYQKIKSKEIDLDHIEFGIHEFRRQLRWLGIYSSALMGKVVLSKEKAKDPLSKYLTQDNKNHRFNILPEFKEIENPVLFLRSGFYAIGELIKDIGEIKDRGLITFELLQLGDFMGIKHNVIKTCLGKDYYPEQQVLKDAKDQIEKKILQERVLNHVADFFDKQL